MGQISENELLQLRLAAFQAKAVLTEAESEQNAKMFQLRSFLGMGEEEVVVPVVPGEVESVQMEYQTVLEKALERNAFAQNIRRRQLEADYAVAEARGNLRRFDLFARIRLSGEKQPFSSAYRYFRKNRLQVG